MKHKRNIYESNMKHKRNIYESNMKHIIKIFKKKQGEKHVRFES